MNSAIMGFRKSLLLVPVASGGALTKNVASATVDGYLVFDNCETLTKKGTSQQKNLVFTLAHNNNDDILTKFLDTHLTTASTSSMEVIKYANGESSDMSSGSIPTLLAIFCMTSSGNKIKTFITPVSITAVGDEQSASDKYTRFTLEFTAAKWSGTSAITIEDHEYLNTGNFNQAYATAAAVAFNTVATDATAKEIWLQYKDA